MHKWFLSKRLKRTCGLFLLITAPFILQCAAITPQGPGSGSVTGQDRGSGNDFECQWDGTTATATGDCGFHIVGIGGEVVAHPAPGSHLDSWSPDCLVLYLDPLTCTFNPETELNGEITATFNLGLPPLTYSPGIFVPFKVGTGRIVGGGFDCNIDGNILSGVCTVSFSSPNTILVTFIPGPDTPFRGWYGCDSSVGMECTITGGIAKRSFYARMGGITF